MNLNLNLDDKRIKKIVYQLENGKTVEYRFNNGELVETPIVYNYNDESKKCEDQKADVNNGPLLYHIGKQIDGAKEIIEMDKKGVLDEILKKHDTNNNKEPLSDNEMIEAVKKSEFMNELKAARKRFKIDKEIVNGFPEKDDTYRESTKRSEDKCSEESLKVAQEIIKMDKEGKLDEIAAVKRGLIDKPLKTAGKEDNNDLSYESDICDNSIRKIENKVIIALRNGNKEEHEKLMDNY